MVQAGTTDRITPLLHQYYVSRLRSDLSRWVEQGWVKREDMDAILKDAASSGRASGSLPNLLALVGAVLVAAGALLFLAANWEGMARVTKLTVLAAALWGAHAASYAAVRVKADQFAEAMMLLSVALFGAGIMLIGQIYHLSADPPAGVLLWALGAIVAAWAWPSQLAACAALALITLWFTLAAPESALAVYLPFLPVWAAMLPPVLRMRWMGAYQAALASAAWFVVMTLVTLMSANDAAAEDFLRLGSAVAALVLAAGSLLSGFVSAVPFAVPLERYALVGALAGVSLLALPSFHDGQAGGDPWWSGLAVLVLLAALAGAVIRWRSVADRLALGVVALVAVAVACAMVPEEHGWLALAALNLVLVAALIGLIAEGYRRDDRFVVNLGFLAFAATILRLYFDTFWLLFDRSLFFMVGGLLVIALGWGLERKRRNMIGDLGEAA
jgi:uncharacterized membrane protein